MSRDTPWREPGGDPMRGDGFSARLTPARADVAAEYLRGKVVAERFTIGESRQVTAAVLPIRRTPEPDGMQETQALFGEAFTVYDEQGGWAWGQANIDGYVGYVLAEGLSAPVDVPTHRVTALRTYRFPEPDLKSAPLCLISMNSKLTVRGEAVEGKWLPDSRGGYVFAAHVAPMPDAVADPVAAAEAYVGAPYLWGGRESLGLDCSALIQNAYEAAGVLLPRDADMQEAHFCAPGRSEEIWVRKSEDDDWRGLALRRGDLVYWRGHTGLMTDEDTLLHANATHMAVTRDPILAITAHLDEQGTAVTRIVRPRDARALRAAAR